ncbi:hypothetical protein ACT3CD_06870 [Geofilum sp. OHC36d9]|uniref:hypothetical protein n=1 Tax=Geofilum sp. OHC36d9 TaxID=3458413 RepID=UPI0040331625
MIQRDYILRMIEMLGELVAGILNLIKKGELKNAEQKIDRLYYDLLKQDAGYFNDLSEENLTEILLQQHNYTNGHLEMLAELMYVQAELSMARKDYETSSDCYKKSLKLTQFIKTTTRSFSLEKQNRELEIKDKLKHIEQTKPN